MWKCQYCDKMSTDDLKICPHCNAPNPAARISSPSAAGGSLYQQSAGNQRPENGNPNTATRDQSAIFYPDGKDTNRAGKKGGSRAFLWIGIAAVVIVTLTVVMSLQRKEEEAPKPIKEQMIDIKGNLGGAIDAKQPDTEQKALAATDAPKLEKAPFTVHAAVPVYLDFGETYFCSANDFRLPYPVEDQQISWACASNEAGTTCTQDGYIVAGAIQVDAEKEYNDTLQITGTTANGSRLIYDVITGDGTSYDFHWSSDTRQMKNYIGAVIIASPMVINCSGFTIYYEYELTKGSFNSDRWSVWVRQDGTTWVRVQDISLKNKNGDVFNIVFNEPMSFSEIVVQPETYSNTYEYNDSFAVGYLIFDS